LLITSLKLIVIDAMELASLARYYSTISCRFNVCTEHPGCQSIKPQPMGEGVLLS